MRDYSKPEIYLLGSVNDFINGTGHGNANDFYTSVCEAGALITSETCGNNPTSPICQYFAGQGFVVGVVKNSPPCN